MHWPLALEHHVTTQNTGQPDLAHGNVRQTGEWKDERDEAQGSWDSHEFILIQTRAGWAARVYTSYNGGWPGGRVFQRR
jgi:hypothetical protein